MDALRQNQHSTKPVTIKDVPTLMNSPELDCSALFEPVSLPEASKPSGSVARSPISLLMIIVILFSAITGLLMGYDLCMIAVILQPIIDEFQVCPVASTTSNTMDDFHALDSKIQKASTFPTEEFRSLSSINIPSVTYDAADTFVKTKIPASRTFPHTESEDFLTKAFIQSVFTKSRNRNKMPCALGTLCAMHNWDLTSPVSNISTAKKSNVTTFLDKTDSSDSHIRHLQEGEAFAAITEDDADSSDFQSCGAKQLFVSIVSPGAAIGSLLSGFIADAFGRKFTLGLSDVLIMIGTMMMGLAHIFSLVVAGRFILGLGVGTGFVIFSTYVSEISPDDRRGQLVSCQEVAQCLGCLAAYCVAALAKDANIWRGMLLAAGVVAAIQTAGITLLPESPRWLIRKNKLEKAQQSLRRLAGLSRRQEDDDATNLDNGNDLEKGKSQGNDNCSRPLSTTSQKKRRKPFDLESREQSIAQTLRSMIEERHSEDLRIQSRTPSKQNQKKKVNLLKQQQLADGETSSHGGLQMNFDQESNYSFPSIPHKDSCSVKQRESSNIQVLEQYTSKNAIPLDGESYPIFNQLELSPKTPGQLHYMDINDYSEERERSAFSKFLHKKIANVEEVVIACLIYWRPICIAVGCAICQNFTASTAILYYSAEIFSLSGVENPFVAGTGIGLAKVAGITIIIFTVERVGRKRYLLVGSTGTLMCHLLFALAFTLKLKSTNEIIQTRIAPMLTITVMILYMFCLNISWAGLMFVVASEVLPSGVRGIGMGFTITAFWIFAFFSQSTLETIMQYMSVPGLFLFYAFLNVLALTFTWIYIPELSGKSLEEISETFG